MLIDSSEHHTEPLPLVANSDFHAYLVRYRLTWMDVARASGVRSLTVWSIIMVNPFFLHMPARSGAGYIY
jgi:hypothetical protein